MVNLTEETEWKTHKFRLKDDIEMDRVAVGCKINQKKDNNKFSL